MTENKIASRYHLLVILTSLLGMGMILFATHTYGAYTGPDSAGYAAVARHLSAGLGLLSFDDEPLIIQPPLYPVLLGGIAFVLGADPLVSAGVINALLFGATVYVAGHLFLRHVKTHPAFAIFGLVSLLLSIPLVKVFLMAISEPLFIFLVTLYLYCLSVYSETKNMAALMLLSVVTAFACLTRYLGVVFVLTGILSIVVDAHKNLKTKFLHIVFFTCGASLPIGVWALRNYSLSGTLFGYRQPSTHGLYENIGYVFDVTSHWYLPDWLIHNFPMLAWLVPLLVCCMALALVVKHGLNAATLKSLPLFVIFAFLAFSGFLALLIISSTTTAYDVIDDRLLSPMVIPLMWLLVFVLERLYLLLKQHFWGVTLNVLTAMLVILCLLYPAASVFSMLMKHAQEGGGYSARFWWESQTIEYLRHNALPGCVTYSNDPFVVYLFLDVKVRYIPFQPTGADVVASLAERRDSVPQEDHICLIWFAHEKPWLKYAFTAQDLNLAASPERIAQFKDGAIYFLVFE